MADFTIKIESQQTPGAPKPPGQPGAPAVPGAPVVPGAPSPGQPTPSVGPRAINTGGLGSAAQTSILSRVFGSLRLAAVLGAASAVASKMMVVSSNLSKAASKIAEVSKNLAGRAMSSGQSLYQRFFGRKDQKPQGPKSWKDWADILWNRASKGLGSDWGRAARGVGSQALASTGSFGSQAVGLASRFGGLALKAGKAALSNPYTAAIAAAVVAVTGFAIAVGAAVGVMKKLFDVTNQTTRELANFSPTIRGIVRRLEVSELLRQRQRADVLAPSLETTAAARSRFNQQWFEMKLTIEKGFYETIAALSPLMDIASLAIRGVTVLIKIQAHMMSTAWDVVIGFFNAISPQSGLILKLLSQLSKWMPKLEGSDPDISALIDMGYGGFDKSPTARPIF